MIPRILHRVVPEVVPEEYERYWTVAQELHPDWEFRTWQDPIDPDGFESAHLWPHVESGAQLAGLVRLEVLWKYGGIYLDMDIEPMRSLEPLLQTSGFACWENERVIPDAVLGFEAGHPAVRECLDRALSMSPEEGAWATGPGVSTSVLKHRPDVLLLAPASFYPYYYTEPGRAGENFGAMPWVYGVHRWHGSWRTTRSSPSLRRSLRAPRRALRRMVVSRSARWGAADRLRELSRDGLADTIHVSGTLTDGEVERSWRDATADTGPASLDLALISLVDHHIEEERLVDMLRDVRGALHVGGTAAVITLAPQARGRRRDRRAIVRAAESRLVRAFADAGFREVQPVRAASVGASIEVDGRRERIVGVTALR